MNEGASKVVRPPFCTADLKAVRSKERTAQCYREKSGKAVQCRRVAGKHYELKWRSSQISRGDRACAYCVIAIQLDSYACRARLEGKQKMLNTLHTDKLPRLKTCSEQLCGSDLYKSSGLTLPAHTCSPCLLIFTFLTSWPDSAGGSEGSAPSPRPLV